MSLSSVRHVCVSLRQQRSLAGKACVSRMVVDKYVYLNKAGTPTVEVWDKRSERMVDCIDCAQIIRYTHACMHELTVFFYYVSLLNIVHDLLLQSTRMQLCVHFSLQTRLWLQRPAGQRGGAAHRGGSLLGQSEGSAGAERCNSLDRHQRGPPAAAGALQTPDAAGHRPPLQLHPLHWLCTHRWRFTYIHFINYFCIYLFSCIFPPLEHGATCVVTVSVSGSFLQKLALVQLLIQKPQSNSPPQSPHIY